MNVIHNKNLMDSMPNFGYTAQQHAAQFDATLLSNFTHKWLYSVVCSVAGEITGTHDLASYIKQHLQRHIEFNVSDYDIIHDDKPAVDYTCKTNITVYANNRETLMNVIHGLTTILGIRFVGVRHIFAPINTYYDHIVSAFSTTPWIIDVGGLLDSTITNKAYKIVYVTWYPDVSANTRRSLFDVIANTNIHVLESVNHTEHTVKQIRDSDYENYYMYMFVESDKENELQHVLTVLQMHGVHAKTTSNGYHTWDLVFVDNTDPYDPQSPNLKNYV